MSARLLNAEEYYQYYDSLADNTPIYYSPEWIDIVCEGKKWWVAVVEDKGNNTNGIWPVILYKKYMYNFGFNPILTPFFGPFLYYPSNIQKTESILSFEKKIISQLIDILPDYTYIKIKCHPYLTNWLPMHWRGYEQTTQYTYQLHFENSKNPWKNYTSSIRSEIDKVPQDIMIHETDLTSEVYDLASKSYTSQNSKIYYSKETFTRLDDLLKKSNSRNIYIASRGDRVLAGIYVFRSLDTVYLPIIGRGSLQKDESGIVKKLLHYAIEDARHTHAKVFDFEGSMFEQFEKVFRSFGSTQVPYHTVSHYQSKLLRKLLI